MWQILRDEQSAIFAGCGIFGRELPNDRANFAARYQKAAEGCEDRRSLMLLGRTQSYCTMTGVSHLSFTALATTWESQDFYCRACER